MRTHFRLAALSLLTGSLISAYHGDKKSFFIMMAVALELYAMTEMEIDWTEKFQLRNIPALMKRSNNISLIGLLTQYGAYLCLFGYFLSHL